MKNNPLSAAIIILIGIAGYLLYDISKNMTDHVKEHNIRGLNENPFTLLDVNKSGQFVKHGYTKVKSYISEIAGSDESNHTKNSQVSTSSVDGTIIYKDTINTVSKNSINKTNKSGIKTTELPQENNITKDNT